MSLPDNYEPEGDKSPLLLFLHGGDRSNTKHNPKRYAARNQIDFPFVVVAPHCTGACNWRAVDFEGLLREVAQTYNVDRARFYATGYSMGGRGTWDLLTQHSEWFAAAAPIAGMGSPEDACKIQDVAIRAYHGDADNVIPSSGSKDMVEALIACDVTAELVLYPGVEHGSWVRTYQDANFYSWLLSHSR